MSALVLYLSTQIAIPAEFKGSDYVSNIESGIIRFSNLGLGGPQSQLPGGPRFK